MAHGFATAETTVAIALLAGIVAQSLARHLRVPGIVVLLGVGVLLGPDVAGAVQPDLLGDGLLMLVGFAVAVILFEGAMSLDVGRLRREGRVIRRLLTSGALITAVGGTLSARLVIGMPWVTSVLFGTLVIVTGPTVITPLMRRFRVKRATAAVLEAEGVLIDALGAVVAIVALQVALSPSGRNVALRAVSVPMTLGAGVGLGLVGGYLLSTMLRSRTVIPDGLENIGTLSAVLALFQVSNSIMPESGIAAVTAAGIVVGNRHTGVGRDLREFKEQLTVLFIGLLFVLLAADVRIADVVALGWPGVITVAILIVVVRPLNVLVATRGSELSTQQRVLLAVIGPRGIVAAAVAAFFAAELERAQMPGGEQLRALVFLVIVVTVVVAAVGGGLAANMLGLSRATDHGFVILGANGLARALAQVLVAGGEDVVCIDTNPDACEAARRAGLRVIFGSGMRESILARAEVDTRRGAIALTSSTEVNLLFAQRVREEAKGPLLLVAARRSREDTTRALLGKTHARLLFGGPARIEQWAMRVDDGSAEVRRYRVADAVDSAAAPFSLEGAPAGALLPLAFSRAGTVSPVDDQLTLRKGDVLELLIVPERAAAADGWLLDQGIARVQDAAA